MLRGLIEIIAYSKFAPMSKSPKISFRAVAAPSDDPLSEPYDLVLGKNGRNVKAGYLLKQDGKWKIQPAKRPDDLGLLERGAYLKVKDGRWITRAVGGLKRFNDEDYLPQFRPVSFETETRTDRQNRKYTAITNISGNITAYGFKGALVCSGNMLETSGEDQESPRKNYSLVPEPDKTAPPIAIREEAISDYLDSLTPFLQEEPFDPINGCLIQYQPVFYVEQDGMAICFGHCPNFRVPAFLKETNRAATPTDFRPKPLCCAADVDFAEVIFGYVEKKRSDAKQGDKANAYASRLRITDATTEATDVFLSNSPFTPEILATPKPTAFQHYLVQKSDSKRNLKHYGSSPEDTVIRGSKLYWKQGDRTLDSLRAKPDTPKVDSQGNVDRTSTQHTQMKPVRSGISFKFRVYFESLSKEELGVLCWALHPLGDAQKAYCHQLGMGKPLGMGVVMLEATLHLNQRKKRYESLFDKTGWATGYAESGLKLSERSAEIKAFTDAFETRIRQELKVEERCTRLAELKRIAMLLKMMEWEDFPPANRARTQMLEEFKQRYVLPDPSFWFSEVERGCLIEPTPMPTPSDKSTAHPDAGINTKPQSQKRAPQSGMGNTLIVTSPPSTTKSAKPQSAKEKVTLIGNVRDGRARVKTEQGEEINCEKMNAFDGHKTGSVVWAKVERERSGKAISAKYIPE